MPNREPEPYNIPDVYGSSTPSFITVVDPAAHARRLVTLSPATMDVSQDRALADTLKYRPRLSKTRR